MELHIYDLFWKIYVFRRNQQICGLRATNKLGKLESTKKWTNAFSVLIISWDLVTMNKSIEYCLPLKIKSNYQSCWECCWSYWDNNSLLPTRFCFRRWCWSVCRSLPLCWCWKKKRWNKDQLVDVNIIYPIVPQGIRKWRTPELIPEQSANM